MTIAAIVTRGFSNGSFIGSISELVTMGYTIGAEIPSQSIGNVTAGFADSELVSFKANDITTQFKADSITVGFN